VPGYKAEDVAGQFNCSANGTSNNAADGTGVAIAFTVAFRRGRLGQGYCWPQRDRRHDSSEHLLAHVCLVKQQRRKPCARIYDARRHRRFLGSNSFVVKQSCRRSRRNNELQPSTAIKSVNDTDNLVSVSL
jgi:hypothetical protein